MCCDLAYGVSNGKCDWNDTMVKNESSTDDDYSSRYSIKQNTNLGLPFSLVAGESVAFCADVYFWNDTSANIVGRLCWHDKQLGHVRRCHDGSHLPLNMKFSVSDIAPGYDGGYLVWCLKNAGTISGQPYVEFSAITNDENGGNEPESIAEGMPFAHPEGELGQYLKYTIGTIAFVGSTMT
jgi:hypothetical protein